MAGNSKLFSFIFLTVKASANDPKSKNFLPKILSNIQRDGEPLLPLKEDSWTVGKLGGTSGLTVAKNIADKYFLLNGDPAIPYPNDPEPSLELKDDKGVDKVVIEGLDNVFVTGFDNYNYDEASATVTADVNMQFNYWTRNPEGLQPGQKVTPLALSTPFILTQYLCTIDNLGDKKCKDPNAKPISIVGNGIFTANITQLNFVASIKIGVKPKRAGLDVQVTKLSLITSGAEAPKFIDVDAKLSNISDYQDLISASITSFMSAPEASDAVFTQMQASLNTPTNIDALSNTMTEQFANFLDTRLGPVTGALPSDTGQKSTNKVDLYIFDRIRYSLNNPSSSWYVQTLLKNYNNPSLNPFKPDDLSIGSFEIFAGFKLSNVTLSNVVVTGFPNATAPADQMLLTPPTLNILVLLGSLGSGTSATADFSASYTGGILKFGVTITAKSVSLTSVVTPSGADASELVITFDSITYKVPNVNDMQITISDQTGLGPAVQKVLNTSEVQDKIVSAVNGQFQNHLSAISNEVTKLITALLNQQLGANKELENSL
ncbi:hypothetical protein [Aquimarina sediminis]|uniref:hypothetical protein n=1 Tax=Aquimarina sediminis TaxID=2070536 RepID=UPI000CA00D29|nr:hypothetical protein [Aquimarina sediminis]